MNLYFYWILNIEYSINKNHTDAYTYCILEWGHNELSINHLGNMGKSKWLKIIPLLKCHRPQWYTLRVGRKPENMKFNSKGNILIKDRTFCYEEFALMIFIKKIFDDNFSYLIRILK